MTAVDVLIKRAIARYQADCEANGTTFTRPRRSLCEVSREGVVLRDESRELARYAITRTQTGVVRLSGALEISQ